jgi:hypothetical protein
MAEGKYPTDGWVEHVRFADLTDAIEQLRHGKRMKLLIDLPELRAAKTAEWSYPAGQESRS